MYDETERLPRIGRQEPPAADRSGRMAGGPADSGRARTADGSAATGSRSHARPARRGVGRTVGRLSAQVVVALASTVVLAGTALAWQERSSFDNGFQRSEALDPAAPHSLNGDINFLMIGLDTRKDLNGNDLPKAILNQLHAGDGQEGGYNANSLILLHIPANMQKIVAFSIPRDDYVAVTGIPGYDHAKIKESYGLKKADTESKLMAKGEKDPVKLEFLGREAGRQSIVKAVETLTGVPIDRFAEVSLFGFYDLAKELGGVDVCLNHAVKDTYYSGANFPAGPQHLNPSQSLAFVRQRHGLDNGDLDRTHRQQAFVSSVAKALRDSGRLTDISQLNALMDVAHKDVVLSGGWKLSDFAVELGGAKGMSVEFRTLPILRYGQVDGQDVNIVNPAAIKKTVRMAFGLDKPAPAVPATPPTSTVDVLNASSIPGQAGKVSDALIKRGYKAGKVGNATSTEGSSSVISYGPGAETDAKQLSKALGGMSIEQSSTAAAGHIKVVIGTDFSMPADLADTAAAEATPAAPATAEAPDTGKPVTTTIGAEIPCVN